MDFFNSFMHALSTLALGIATWIVLVVGSFGANIAIKNASLPTPSQKVIQSPAVSSTKSVATTTQKSKAVPTPKKKAPTPLPQTPLAGQAAPSAPPVITNEIIAQTNTQVRPSLVNILCTFRTANTSSYISGSGLIIDPRGVILTNAHVAQFFLLQDYPNASSTSCIVRTGSPATATYNATLLYLPPVWIESNASQILSDIAMGTGERDYAFLYITGPTQFAPPLPSSFPALSLSIENPKLKDPVLLAGYPAGFLDANGIQRNLYVSSAVSAIEKLYAFLTTDHVDLVSLGGTVVSQSGSSGGAVINLVSGRLIGLIATESEGTTTASRDLRAITLLHVDKSLKEDGKDGIFTLLSGDLLKTAQNFNTNVAPGLTKQLVAAIEKQFH